MAKNNFPGLKTGSGLVPKLVGGLIVVALLAMTIRHPADAANWVSGAASWFAEVVDGLVTFLRETRGT